MDAQAQLSHVPLPDGNWVAPVIGQPWPCFVFDKWLVLKFDGFNGVEVEYAPEEEPQGVLTPEVVITAISADPTFRALTTISPDLRMVDTMAGATLTFTTELRANGQRLPTNGVFRMPLKSVGSPINDRLIKVEFIEGVATFVVKLPDSRHWRVTKETINQSLEADEQLDFAGLDVYVME